MKELNAYWKEITLLLCSLGARCLICGHNQQQIDETILAAEAFLRCVGSIGGP